MNTAKDLFDELTSAQWRSTTSTELEIEYLHLREDCISTSKMYRKDHFRCIGDPSGHPWLDVGYLPYFFNPEALQQGLEKLATGKTDICRIPLTHYCGNTDTDNIYGTLKDEALEIARLPSGEFELREISNNQITVRYRRTP